MSVVIELLWNTIYCVTYLIYRITGVILGGVQNVWYHTPVGNNSCQVLKILWRRKLFKIDVASPLDFIGIHETFLHPNYVLGRNISLYCVTADQAIFVETPVDINIYSSKINPFQYIGQFDYAVKIIQMPMTAFHALAAEIGNPKVPVGYLASTGRCGSTILAQALEYIPGVLVHAEPDCLTNICRMRYDKGESTADLDKLLVSTIKILCKPKERVTAICIKVRSCASVHIDTIAKYFPEIKIMFGYRNSKSTVSSFLGLMISETVQSLSLYAINNDCFSKVVPYFRRQLHYYFVSALDKKQVLLSIDSMNAVELFAYSWSCSMVLVEEHKKKYGFVLPILYEDLVDDARAVCAKVFEALQIDLTHMETALTAFEGDSQAGSPLNKDNINNYDRRRIIESDRVRADKILRKFGLPALGVEFRL